MAIKKRWAVLWLAFLLMPLVMLGLMHTVQAAAQGAEFYLAPLYPDNQTDNNLGYFVLKVTPGQRGKVGVQVQNTSKTDTRKIRLTPTSATTNDAGQINYTPSTKKADATLQHPLNQLFSKPVTITVDPEQSKVVTFEYIVPTTGFKGQILGSIYALDVTEDKAASGQFALRNQFAMALGVILSQDPAQTLTPDLKLRQVRPGLSNKQPAILARLQNQAPQLFRGMAINARVTKRGEKETMYSAKLTGGSMAPNSNFDLPISAAKKGISAGQYTLHMTVQAVDKTWQFTRNFTVSEQEANKFAKRQTGTQSPWQKWLWWIVLALAVLIIGYGLYLLGVRRGHQNESTDKHDS
ncbi:MAG: DUF916 and DUF3324 domain-containing protein [Schleiferilactobacillus harbinensis]|jgi:hypothetical protein|nr:DUF916 and DUF3324 domain-containing protein [Schleiferilactobacillus harbinensis]MCI1913723.1 DUF916 and DUF3324 domain-containing protein [Schleiferilactobacillus harbinensis]